MNRTLKFLALALCSLLSACGEEPVSIAPAGPQHNTVLPQSPQRTPVDVYRSNNRDALAILLQDTSASWLGLVHGLKSIGVPIAVTSSAEEAMQHDVVLVYPLLTGSSTTPQTLQSLADHVRSGKTVIAFSVIGGGMPELFGFEDTVEHNNLNSVEFRSTEFTDQFISEPLEATIQLSDLDDPAAGLPGVSYSNSKHPPVAVYPDGSAAITHNFFEDSGNVGHAYAIGFDFGHYILRAHNGRLADRSNSYVNTYQPQVDTLLRFLATAYQEGEDHAVLLYPTPHNKQFTALLTHDVDYTRSFVNAVEYANFEQMSGVPATYFVQTKYVRDYNDDAFLVTENLPVFDDLDLPGLEIASHTVAHSNEFRNMPLGSGRELYPDYQPFVFDFETVRDASILGELRISKYLLEHFTSQQIRSFRPGHLSLPEALPQALAAAGYQYSSSITANEAMTHLPYRLMHDRSYDTEVDVFEFPVTIEDEAWRLGDRIDEAIAIADRIGRYGGLFNMLIHTDISGHKLDFEKAIVEAFRDSAHFDTLGGFGDWWRVRDMIQWNVEARFPDERVLLLTSAESIEGLTLELPAGWQYQSGLAGSTQNGRRLILGDVSGSVRLTFSYSGTIEQAHCEVGVCVDSLDTR